MHALRQSGLQLSTTLRNFHSMRLIISAFAQATTTLLVLLLISNVNSTHAQNSSEVNYSGWGDESFWVCGTCTNNRNACYCAMSFYPITTHKDCAADGARAKRKSRREDKQCDCINKAISEYALTWVALQSREITIQEALSRLNLHLECADHCGRWKDCENLLNFIDQEVAEQRAKPGTF